MQMGSNSQTTAASNLNPVCCLNKNDLFINCSVRECCKFLIPPSPSQVIINSTITPNMTFTKTSQKFGQWADSRANTVFGLGFGSEQQLAKVGSQWVLHGGGEG